LWSREEVDGRLKTILDEIRSECITYGKQPDDSINYVQGASLAGFVKVAEALLAYGAVREKFFARNCQRMKGKHNESF